MVRNNGVNYERLSVNDDGGVDGDSNVIFLDSNDVGHLMVEDDINLSDDELPTEPPNYENVSQGETTPFDDEMQMEDGPRNYHDDTSMLHKMKSMYDSFHYCFIVGIKEKVLDPFFIISEIISEKIDYYLNKIGNPLILRRFFYIIFMSIVSFIVISSGLLPSSNREGLDGMFSNFPVLLQYAKESFDLGKLENDLEYLSSMPHSSGSRGDAAIKDYIRNSFNGYGLKSVVETEYPAYSNYYNSSTLTLFSKDDKKIEIPLSSQNWNPLSASGSLQKSDIVYVNKGTLAELSKLQEKNLISDNSVFLMHYSKLVSEQVLAAQQYGAKGIIFISDSINDNSDLIQVKSVALNQFYTGDALTPGWTGHAIQNIDFGRAPVLPKILTIPLSMNQAQKILSLLSHKGVKFDNNIHSGQVGDVKIDLSVNTTVRERHPVYNIIGKIDGREQNDKAIIIAASRNSYSYGTSNPNFGTSVLLSLIQVFETFKFKFNWRPLRSIYFVSFGGSEFNFAGAAEYVEQKSAHLRNEIYTVLDISQLDISSDDREINVQTHPLLQSFFMDDDNKQKFDVHVSDVHQYGDWTPFLATGIPVAVLSSKLETEIEPLLYTDQDTFDRYSEMLHDNDKKNLVNDLLTYLVNTVLQLTDAPLIPFDLHSYYNSVKSQLSKAESLYGNKLNFKDVIHSFRKWKTVAIEQDSWLKSWTNIVVEHSSNLEPSLLSIHRWNWNKRLAKIGVSQIYSRGVYTRTQYKNIMFGPALWTENLNDDSAWTFPGVRDASTEEDWKAAQEQLNIISTAFIKSLELFMDGASNLGY